MAPLILPPENIFQKICSKPGQLSRYLQITDLYPELIREAAMNRTSSSIQGIEQSPQVPWSVDRYGRLLAGLGIMLFTLMGLLLHPLWLLATLFSAINLILTSITDRCPIKSLLLRMGAKEREDLFLPGGTIRTHPSPEPALRRSKTEGEPTCPVH